MPECFRLGPSEADRKRRARSREIRAWLRECMGGISPNGGFCSAEHEEEQRLLVLQNRANAFRMGWQRAWASVGSSR